MMSNYSLEQEIDKVARQLAGVEAQLQTALDTLVTTNNSVPPILSHHNGDISDNEHNRPVINTPSSEQAVFAHNFEDLHSSIIGACNEKKYEEDDKTKQKTHDESAGTGGGKEENKYENKWQTNISTPKDELTEWRCQRRTPASNVTIIRITASKPQLSIIPTTQCSSLVRIENAREDDFIDNEKDDTKDKQELIEYAKKPCRISVAQTVADVIDNYKAFSINNTESVPIRAKIVKRSQSVVASHGDQAEVFQLKQHCRSLEGELDGVKSEIMRILSEKNGVLKENRSLKDLQIENDALKEENKNLKQKFEQVFDNNSPFQSPNSSQEDIVLELPDRSSPDGEELNKISKESTSDKLCHGKQNKKDDQIKLLEESLELMKFEFDNMETYWRSKLESERKFYEKHIEQNESKFEELQQQIINLVKNLESGQSGEESLRKLQTITE